MLRPLVTAIIEYALAYLVYKNGTLHRKEFAITLFCLATYQLGEVVIFLTGGGEIGFKIAYVATTLLPPLGLLLLEKILNKNFGYKIIQALAIIFCVYILLIPRVATSFELGQFCVRVYEYAPMLAQYWTMYYQLTLLFSMGIMIWGIFRAELVSQRELLFKMLIAYASFDALSIFIAYYNPWFWPSIASLMCALAVIASFIFARISLGKNYAKILKQLPHFK